MISWRLHSDGYRSGDWLAGLARTSAKVLPGGVLQGRVKSWKQYPQATRLNLPSDVMGSIPNHGPVVEAHRLQVAWAVTLCSYYRYYCTAGKFYLLEARPRREH
jgi:hypothetical protein